ncbi:MAG TPA: arginine decarboxylase, pyruvoyl-dependent [Methanocorpusculum sp.]|nr:arginine decarboxylase, pyruvoyl-dependent [Methanocorpusculum sp.]
MVVPSKVFFTKGCGVHKEKLISFEMALRNAGIAPYNLVCVSSIMPPDADIITRDEGVKYLKPGEIVYCVMARVSSQSDEIISASIGLAAVKEHKNQHGYLSECCKSGVSAKTCGEHAEKLAAEMLSTILNPEAEGRAAEKVSGEDKVYSAGGKEFKTSHISIDAVSRNGVWTTVIAAAVFVCT